MQIQETVPKVAQAEIRVISKMMEMMIFIVKWWCFVSEFEVDAIIECCTIVPSKAGTHDQPLCSMKAWF